MPSRGTGKARPPTSPRSALHRALRLLARRAHTRWELARKLTAKGESPSDIEAALDRVTALGYLDDHHFARVFVEVGGGARGGWGTARLRLELRRRGVAPETVEAVLAGRTSEDDLAAARILVSRRRGDPPARITLFLRQRGYAQHVIRRALEEHDASNPEE